MTYTPEQGLHRALVFLGQGIGGSGKSTGISQEAINAFYDRYDHWIGVVKETQTKSPLQVWNDPGVAFDGRFRLIGEYADQAASGREINTDDVLVAAKKVEGESACPYCP